MSAPTKTYTFVAGTTIVAAEVNQNFDDVINGYTDGTKDLTLSTLTANASVKLVETGGGTDKVTIVAPAAVSTAYTLTLPGAVATRDKQALVSTTGGVISFADGAIGSLVTKTNTDYTVLDNDGYLTILVSTGNTNRTITLPTAADNTNRILTIKKTDTGTGQAIVDGEGAETIDGVATFLLVDQDDFVTVQCDGSGWVITNKGIGVRVLSRVKHETAAGYGSTNTKISRIETSIVATGNAITAATSATNGNSYTINQKGVYSISFGELGNAATINFGISVNSAELTTNIQSITAANRLIQMAIVSSGNGGTITWTGVLAAGDVIRPHTDGGAQTANDFVFFDIRKISI